MGGKLRPTAPAEASASWAARLGRGSWGQCLLLWRSARAGVAGAFLTLAWASLKNAIRDKNLYLARLQHTQQSMRGMLPCEGDAIANHHRDQSPPTSFDYYRAGFLVFRVVRPQHTQQTMRGMLSSELDAFTMRGNAFHLFLWLYIIFIVSTFFFRIVFRVLGNCFSFQVFRIFLVSHTFGMRWLFYFLTLFIFSSLVVWCCYIGLYCFRFIFCFLVSRVFQCFGLCSILFWFLVMRFFLFPIVF